MNTKMKFISNKSIIANLRKGGEDGFHLGNEYRKALANFTYENLPNDWRSEKELKAFLKGKKFYMPVEVA